MTSTIRCSHSPSINCSHFCLFIVFHLSILTVFHPTTYCPSVLLFFRPSICSPANPSINCPSIHTSNTSIIVSPHFRLLVYLVTASTCPSLICPFIICPAIHQRPCCLSIHLSVSLSAVPLSIPPSTIHPILPCLNR
ncbi:hypothetical protein GOODEAATRI_007495 [Goodea atripinnis]|uniref:Uncharacterized protein n=1 Tax=Goodea atripinnis TaxID=208336 RepID=A0ABV0P2L0_9TELE